MLNSQEDAGSAAQGGDVSTHESSSPGRAGLWHTLSAADFKDTTRLHDSASSVRRSRLNLRWQLLPGASL